MSIELTDVASQDIWAPDDGEVFRSHPGPLGVQRHLVQVPHQEVNRPENMNGHQPQGVACIKPGVFPKIAFGAPPPLKN